MEENTVTTDVGTTGTRQRSPVRRMVNGMLLVVAFCALAVGGFQVASGRWHATPVLSGSMRPGLQPGDVVVTQRVPISDLHVRDVIVFHPPNERGRQTVHRIVKLTVKSGTTSITTRGDANTIDDPIVSSLSGSTAYRVVRVIPLVGYPAVWLQNGNHGLLAIALGTILLIAAVVTVLRRDKPTKPPGVASPTESSNDLMSCRNVSTGGVTGDGAVVPPGGVSSVEGACIQAAAQDADEPVAS